MFRQSARELGNHMHMAWDGFSEAVAVPTTKAGLLLGGVVTYHVGILSRSVLWMLLLAGGALLLDFAAGVYFAWRRKDPETGKRAYSTDVLYDGVWRKIGRSFLILVGGLWDGSLVVLGDFFGQNDLVELWSGILPWTMLAAIWIIIGESSSTLQTIAQHGGENAVPRPFRMMAKAIRQWVQNQAVEQVQDEAQNLPEADIELEEDS